jgi:hypothetical protein
VRRAPVSLLLLLTCACGAGAPGGWSAPRPIDRTGGGAAPAGLAIALSAAGDATAVWRRPGGPGQPSDIQAVRMSGATGAWGPTTTLSARGGGGADQVDLDVAAAGGVVVTWRQPSEGLDSIWSSWVEGDAWHSPALVEIDDQGDAQQARVAALPDGQAWAVWNQWDGLRWSLWVNRLVPPAWRDRALLETTDSADALEPDVASDPAGNALAVWTQNDGELATVWASQRAAADAAWAAPTMLSTFGRADDQHTPAPRVALDTNGDGLAIWTLSTNGAWTVWAARYHADPASWDLAVPVEPESGGDATDATMAFDANGDAYATWRQRGDSSFDVWVDRFVARTGAWTEAVALDDPGGDATVPAISAAGDGHAVVVWQQRAHDAAVLASRFDAVTGSWSAPERLATDGALETPRVAVDAAGQALAIWARPRDGSYDVLAAHQAFR